MGFHELSSWFVRVKRLLCMWPEGETLWSAMEASPDIRSDVKRIVHIVKINGGKSEVRLEDEVRGAMMRADET